MTREEYFGTQIAMMDFTFLIMHLNLEELEKEMAVAKIVTPITHPKEFENEASRLAMYQELTACLREYQTAAKTILKRNGVMP